MVSDNARDQGEAAAQNVQVPPFSPYPFSYHFVRPPHAGDDLLFFGLCAACNQQEARQNRAHCSAFAWCVRDAHGIGIDQLLEVVDGPFQKVAVAIVDVGVLGVAAQDVRAQYVVLLLAEVCVSPQACVVFGAAVFEFGDGVHRRARLAAPERFGDEELIT